MSKGDDVGIWNNGLRYFVGSAICSAYTEDSGVVYLSLLCDGHTIQKELLSVSFSRCEPYHITLVCPGWYRRAGYIEHLDETLGTK